MFGKDATTKSADCGSSWLDCQPDVTGSRSTMSLTRFCGSVFRREFNELQSSLLVVAILVCQPDVSGSRNKMHLLNGIRWHDIELDDGAFEWIASDPDGSFWD